MGAKGKPRKTQVYLRNETPQEKDRERRAYTITWDSKSKQPGRRRACCSGTAACTWAWLTASSSAGRDMRRQWEPEARRCWSVVGAARSLDLVCLTDFDLEQWMAVLRRLPMRSKEMARKEEDRQHRGGRQDGGRRAGGGEAA